MILFAKRRRPRVKCFVCGKAIRCERCKRPLNYRTLPSDFDPVKEPDVRCGFCGFANAVTTVGNDVVHSGWCYDVHPVNWKSYRDRERWPDEALRHLYSVRSREPDYEAFFDAGSVRKEVAAELMRRELEALG